MSIFFHRSFICIRGTCDWASILLSPIFLRLIYYQKTCLYMKKKWHLFEKLTNLLEKKNVFCAVRKQIFWKKTHSRFFTIISPEIQSSQTLPEIPKCYLFIRNGKNLEKPHFNIPALSENTSSIQYTKCYRFVQTICLTTSKTTYRIFAWWAKEEKSFYSFYLIEFQTPKQLLQSQSVCYWNRIIIICFYVCAFVCMYVLFNVQHWQLAQRIIQTCFYFLT